MRACDVATSVLSSLKLTDRTDAICELIARRIIECAVDGFDRVSVYDGAMSELSNAPPPSE